jgi:hypothetical protein
LRATPLQVLRLPVCTAKYRAPAGGNIMKLSTLFAKLTSGKAQVLSGLVIAGAALTLAVPAASAQHVAFGIHIGGPRYVAPARVYVAPAPAYVAPAYGYAAPVYAPAPRYDWRAREDWEHQREFYGRPAPSRRDWR